MADRASDVTRIVTGGRAKGLSDDQIRALVARYDERQQQAAPLPAEATAGMLPPSTPDQQAPQPAQPFGSLGIQTVSDDQWAGMSAGEKMRGLLTAGGKALGTAFGMGTDPVDHPGLTLASAAVPLAIQKGPGVLQTVKKGTATAIDRGIARPLGISKSHAGEALDAVREAAVNVRVPDAAGTIAQTGQRAAELQATGARMPRVISKLMARVTNPSHSEMLSFREAEDFASSLSRLSVNEFNALNPQMQRQVVMMRDALRGALTNAAQGVGKGEQYAAGVREYAKGARAAEAWEKVSPMLTKTLRGAAQGAGLGAGYQLFSD